MYPNVNNQDLVNILTILDRDIKADSTMMNTFLDISEATAALATLKSSSAPQTIYTNNCGGQYGSRIASISISVDAVFQTNFQWRLIIDGITKPGISFQSFDPTVNTYEAVPTGKFFLLRPGSNVTIQAFNGVNANATNGIISVSVVNDLLTQYEAQQLAKYRALVGDV